MSRMRKERPTMRIEPGSVVSLATTGLAPSAFTAAYDLWRSTVGDSKDGIPMPLEMPPIRCTMPVPCGVCWYCAQHEARK